MQACEVREIFRSLFDMELRQALAQVSDIHAHLARTEVFRGYRSLTVGFSGMVGLVAAMAQASWLSQPTDRLGVYLAIWIGAAAINVVIVGMEIWSRTRMARTALARRTTIIAVEQFVPSLVAGALLTLIIAKIASDSAWVLPGLWAILFSLGIFASCQLLPRTVFIVGAWYLISGTLALAWGQGDTALSPWIMGITFGLGQLLAAVVLYFTLERFTDRSD